MDEILKALGSISAGEYFGYFLLFIVFMWAVSSVNVNKQKQYKYKKNEVKTLERRKKQ